MNLQLEKSSDEKNEWFNNCWTSGVYKTPFFTFIIY